MPEEKKSSTAGTSLPYSALTMESKDLEMFLSTNGRSENGGQGGEVPGGNVNFASLLLLSQLHSFSPFSGRRLTNLFLSAFFNDTLGLPSVSKANPVVFGVGVLGCGSGPFLCCFAVFPAGETQIWPGDLRVVDVLPGFCLVLDLPRIVEPRCFIVFAIYLPASLIVRTEPQSEINRNRGWAAVLTILHRWQKITAMEFIARGVKIYQWD